MAQHSVYWLYDNTCTSPKTSGYVGVTRDLVGRIRKHRRLRLENGFKVKVLFEGTERQCYKLEIKLRPRAGIGWNLAAGGPEGFKRELSITTRKLLAIQKLGNSHGKGNRGKKRTKEQLKILSEAHLGYVMPMSERKKRSKDMKGRKPSKATIEGLKRSWRDGSRVPSMTGKHHSEKSKKRISRGIRKALKEGRGNRKGFRGKHTKETKALLRAKRLKQEDPRRGKKHSKETKQELSRIATKLNKSRKRNALGQYIN